MALVRIESVAVTHECRIYHDDSAVWDAPHDIGCNITPDPEPGAITITLHSAVRPHTRASLRALLAALIAKGWTTVYAHRRDGHRLPGAVLQPDGRWRLDLRGLAARAA